MNTNNGIKYTDTGAAVAIEIGGEAYANLKRIAEAMNGASWCDADNTPLTVLRGFVLGYGAFDGLESPGELCRDLARDVDTGADDGTPEDARRRGVLLDAFKAACLCA